MNKEQLIAKCKEIDDRLEIKLSEGIIDFEIKCRKKYSFFMHVYQNPQMVSFESNHFTVDTSDIIQYLTLAQQYFKENEK